jgi:hypothetical protein
MLIGCQRCGLVAVNRTLISPATEAEIAQAGVAKIWGGVFLVQRRSWCRRVGNATARGSAKSCSEGPTMKNAAAGVYHCLDSWRRDPLDQWVAVR